MDKGLEQTFVQRRHRNGHKHMKRCTPSLIISEMRLKPTVRYCLTPVRVATWKNQCGLQQVRPAWLFISSLLLTCAFSVRALFDFPYKEIAGSSGTFPAQALASVSLQGRCICRLRMGIWKPGSGCWLCSWQLWPEPLPGDSRDTGAEHRRFHVGAFLHPPAGTGDQERPRIPPVQRHKSSFCFLLFHICSFLFHLHEPGSPCPRCVYYWISPLALTNPVDGTPPSVNTCSPALAVTPGHRPYCSCSPQVNPPHPFRVWNSASGPAGSRTCGCLLIFCAVPGCGHCGLTGTDPCSPCILSLHAQGSAAFAPLPRVLRALPSLSRAHLPPPQSCPSSSFRMNY